MTRKSIRVGLSLILVPLVFVTLATSPALAKWRIHSNDATEMTAPQGGTEDQTCSDRLVGETGWTQNVDSPPDFPDVPDNAFLPLTYEVWKAPPGFTDFTTAVQDIDGNGDPTVTFTDPVTGDPVPATLVEHFTTPARTLVTPPIPVEGTPGPGQYVFTTAPINQALTGISPGDNIGIKPPASSVFVNLAAINCNATQAYSFAGFGGPVNAPPTVNLGYTGDSYKVRFRLKDANGAYVTSLSAVSDIGYQKVDCSTFAGRPTDSIEKTVKGPSKLMFASKPKQFVYRWRTPVTGGCYSLTFEFGGSLQKSVDFRLS